MPSTGWQKSSHASPLMPQGDLRPEKEAFALSHTPQATEARFTHSGRVLPAVLRPPGCRAGLDSESLLERQPIDQLTKRKILHRRQRRGAGSDFSPPEMTQPSSLSGKPILQQPFKWPLRLQSLPRQSTRPMLPDSSFSLLTPLVSGLSPPLQDMGHQAARPRPGSQGLPESLLTCSLRPQQGSEGVQRCVFPSPVL